MKEMVGIVRIAYIVEYTTLGTNRAQHHISTRSCKVRQLPKQKNELLNAIPKDQDLFYTFFKKQNRPHISISQLNKLPFGHQNLKAVFADGNHVPLSKR